MIIRDALVKRTDARRREIRERWDLGMACEDPDPDVLRESTSDPKRDEVGSANEEPRKLEAPEEHEALQLPKVRDRHDGRSAARQIF